MEAGAKAPDHWGLGLSLPRVGVQRPECGQGGFAKGCEVRDAAGNRGQRGQFNKGTSSEAAEAELRGEGTGAASLSRPHFGKAPRTSTLPSPPASCWSLLVATPQGGHSARGLLAEQGEKDRGFQKGKGRPHPVPHPSVGSLPHEPLSRAG